MQQKILILSSYLFLADLAAVLQLTMTVNWSIAEPVAAIGLLPLSRLNIFWMDCLEILHRHLWLLKDESC